MGGIGGKGGKEERGDGKRAERGGKGEGMALGIGREGKCGRQGEQGA